MVGSIFGQQQNRSRSGLFPQLKKSALPVGLFGIDLRQLVVIDVSGGYPDGPGFAGIPGLIALPTPEAAAEPPAPKALLRGLVRLIPPQRIDLFQERLPAKMEMVLVARTRRPVRLRPSAVEAQRGRALEPTFAIAAIPA